jgi:hypothetical protein
LKILHKLYFKAISARLDKSSAFSGSVVERAPAIEEIARMMVVADNVPQPFVSFLS